MDEKTMEQITASAGKLVAAAEALQQTLVAISAQQQEISAKVDRIIAMIDERPAVKANDCTLAKEARTGHPTNIQASRKTLSPLVSMILAKNGVDDGTDGIVLDKALAGLTPEQRIAVKSEMARAGFIQ